jgi:hypothetical protein
VAPLVDPLEKALAAAERPEPLALAISGDLIAARRPSCWRTNRDAMASQKAKLASFPSSTDCRVQIRYLRLAGLFGFKIDGFDRQLAASLRYPAAASLLRIYINYINPALELMDPSRIRVTFGSQLNLPDPQHVLDSRFMAQA